jgi:hypothetical protein
MKPMTSRPFRLITLAGLGLLACALSPAARAQFPGTTPSATAVTEITEPTTLDLRLGAFLLSGVNTQFQLSNSTGAIGSNINFANTLGGDTSVSVFRADATWAISGKHGLDFSWYDIDLRGRRALSADVVYNGQTYTLGTTVESRFRTNVYKLSYGYTFHREGRHEITGLLGAHIVNFQTSLSATSLGKFDLFSVTAPLPSFGLAWKARWSDRLNTRLSLQYFGISLQDDKYSGHFTDFLAATEYRFTDRMGVGAGYNRFDLNADLKSGSHKLNAKYAYNGLLVYLFANF